MADNSQRIAEIQEILRTGARQITNDGQTITFDFNALRKELRQLMSQDDVNRGRRPSVVSIDLSRAF